MLGVLNNWIFVNPPCVGVCPFSLEEQKMKGLLADRDNSNLVSCHFSNNCLENMYVKLRFVHFR